MSLDEIIKDMQSRKLVELKTTQPKIKRNYLFLGKGKANAVFNMLTILATTVRESESEWTSYDEWIWSNRRN